MLPSASCSFADGMLSRKVEADTKSWLLGAQFVHIKLAKRSPHDLSFLTVIFSTNAPQHHALKGLAGCPLRSICRFP